MLKPRVRAKIYLAMAIFGLLIGATQVAFASLKVEQPAWLIVATAVYAYLAGGSGILATLNTPPVPGPATAGTAETVPRIAS